MSAHHFGPPMELMGAGERLCNEPQFGKTKTTTVFHVQYSLLDHGDMVCDHCGERFLKQSQGDF